MNRLTICIFCCTISTVVFGQSEFITTWKTVDLDESITITVNPSIGSALVKYDVDWGDGQSDLEVAGSISHSYATPGDHTVKITGSLPGIQVNVPQGNASKLINISQWGAMPWVVMRDAFRDANKLTIDAIDAPDLSLVTNGSRMLLNCVDLNSSIGHWDVSNIKNMSEMFAGCTKFNQDLSDWDVFNVTTMDRMFYQASAFDQSLGDWEIRLVEEMEEMLSESGLSQTNYDATLTGWEAFGSGQGSLKDGVNLGAGGLFYCTASSVRDILIDDFDWEIVGDTRNCPFITTWRTTVTDESITIYADSNFVYSYNIDWENDSIIDAFGVTGDTSHIYAIPGDHQVVISGLFPHFLVEPIGSNNFNFQLVDINQWGDIQWQSMERSFAYARNLEYSATDKPDLSQVENMNFMFGNTDRFNGDIGDWDVSNVTSMQGTFLRASSFNQDIGGWNVSNVTNMINLFVSAFDFNQDIGDWNVENVESMRGMFSSANSFNQDISKWNTGKVTNMERMFRSATAFNQPLDTLNTSSVTNMFEMFQDATSFNGNINDWNTENVITMSGMFKNAAVFNQPLDQWDVSSVTSMKDMFSDAISFNQDLGDWSIENVFEMDAMLMNTNLSRENYDSTLIGWASQGVRSNITLRADGVFYCAGAAARQSLIDDYDWTILGDIENCSNIGSCTTLNSNWYSGVTDGSWNIATNWSEK